LGPLQQDQRLPLCFGDVGWGHSVGKLLHQCIGGAFSGGIWGGQRQH
jgi:hypothetical protein